MLNSLSKSATLTSIIVIQILIIDLLLSFVKESGMPKEVFLVAGAMFIPFGIIIYRALFK